MGGMRTHSFSSGIGLRGYDQSLIDGWWELLGVTYSRTHYTAPAGEEASGQAADRPPLPSHERIDWRLLHIDHIVMAEDDLLIGLQFHIGASWLWDAKREMSYGTFTGSVASRTRFEGGEFGIGIAKEALATPDGQRFTEAFRLEGIIEIELPDTGTGLGVRAGYHQFGNDESGPAPRRAGAIHSRWFLTPTKWSKFGSYHLAHYGARVESGSYDPFHYAGGWGHELGMFLELNHGL